MSWKLEDIQWNLREDFQSGDCKASNEILYRVMKNQGTDIVERLVTSEMEEEPTQL
jgi:hypothetical protein